jgi:hypothetical protein
VHQIFTAARQAAEIAEHELPLRAAGDRAARCDVRTPPNPHARREIAEVVDDRMLADLEQLRMS